MTQQKNSPEQQVEEQPVEEQQTPPSQPEQTDPDTPAGQPKAFEGQSGVDLASFFATISASLTGHLKPRRKKAKANQEGEEANQPKRRSAPVLVTLTVILLGTGIIAALPKSGDSLPAPLLGTWQTSSEQYADRGFEIGPEQITFQQGEAGKFTTHPITLLRATPTGRTTLFVVEYDNDGDTYEFSFVYEWDVATIRFKNQPLIAWHKKR